MGYGALGVLCTGYANYYGVLQSIALPSCELVQENLCSVSDHASVPPWSLVPGGMSRVKGNPTPSLPLWVEELRLRRLGLMVAVGRLPFYHFLHAIACRHSVTCH